MKYILVKGAGDIATGILVKLHRSGFQVGALELPEPTVIRRTVSFAEAVFGEPVTVESVKGCHCLTAASFFELMESGHVPVFTGILDQLLDYKKPSVFIDATLSKVNQGTTLNLADLVIGVGPGFTAGEDVHAVIETMRGHNLGRIIESGSALPDTGIPGDIGGYTVQRVLRAGAEGVWQGKCLIGDQVEAGQVIGWIITSEDEKVITSAEISGILRGQLRTGLRVSEGMKVADIDPRAERSHCFSISDKARAVAGGVLEAILRHERDNRKND